MLKLLFEYKGKEYRYAEEYDGPGGIKDAFTDAEKKEVEELRKFEDETLSYKNLVMAHCLKHTLAVEGAVELNVIDVAKNIKKVRWVKVE